MSRFALARPRPLVAPRPAAESGYRDRIRRSWVLGALVCVVMIIFYVVFRNGSWVFDDNFILEFARQHGFNLTWLRTPLYQHWGAGTNATFSLLSQVFPIDYRWGLLAALVVLGATIWLFARTFELICSSRRVALAATIWFAFSILWTAPLQWWTFSVQVLPNVLFDLLCLYGFLVYQTDRRRRWVALSAGSILIGLLFYEKPAFMLLYLGLAEVLLTGQRLHPKATIGSFWRDRVLWVSYVAVVALWFIAYLSTSAYPTSEHLRFDQYVNYFRIMWAHALVPALFGLTLPSVGLNSVQNLAIIATQAAVVGVLVFTVRRSPMALRAWVFLAVTVLVTGFLVARSRVLIFGVGIGDDLRYLMDFTWLVPLSICAAIQGGTVLTDPIRRAPRTVNWTFRRPSSGAAVAAVLLAGYVGVSLFTTARLERDWPALQARHWYQNVRHGLDGFSRSGAAPIIADHEVPPEIIGSWEDPYSRLSELLPSYSSTVRVDGPLFGPLVYVDDSGMMHSAVIDPVARGPVSLLNRERRITLIGMVPVGGDCYRTGSAGGSLGAKLDLVSAQSGSETLYLLIDYKVSAPVPTQLFTNRGSGFDPVERVALDPKAGASLAWLGFGDLKRYVLNFPPSASVCLDRVSIVKLRAA